jgi:pimeloyl-ACP methyl ester carboxylesterase
MRTFLSIMLTVFVVQGSRIPDANAKEESFARALPLPQPSHCGYAPVNDIEMYYAVFGSGKPLILLHGGLGNSEHFGNQIPALAQEFEVIAVDSRGHGRSTRSEQPYSYGLMASDVLALMDFLKISKASVLGWSDGAIGLDIAIHHPERLDKLVAFGANYSRGGLRADAKGSNTFAQYLEIAREDYKRLSSTPEHYDAFVQAVEKMWHVEPNYSRDQLSLIKTPTLVIDGESDEIIQRSHIEDMARLIPHSKLKILPGVSHFAMFQRPDEFNEAVLNFLRASSD